jgi:hypothetical protein
MGMLGKEADKDTSQITADAPESMVGQTGGSAPGLDDYYVKNPGAAQTESMAPTDVKSATATSYDATMGEVDPAQTSMNLANDYMGMDGPVQQRAEQEGRRFSAKSGLLNSSIAAGNIAGAVADRVNPLAQTDAGLYGDQRLTNQRATNEASQFNAANETDVSKANAAEANQTLRTDTAVEGDIRMSNTRAENDMMSTVLGANANINQQAMADLGAMQRTLLDIDARKYATDSAKGAQVYSATLAAIGDLYNNPNLSPDAIKKASEHLMTNARSTLNFSMGMDALDLGGTGDGTVSHTGMTPNVQPAPAPAPAPAPSQQMVDGQHDASLPGYTPPYARNYFWSD